MLCARSAQHNDNTSPGFSACTPQTSWENHVTSGRWVIAPKKRSPLFAVPWPVLRLRCLRWKVYQAAPEVKARHIHNHLASVESYFKWAHIFFEGNAKLTYWTLQGLGTSAHTTHYHVAWIIDGKLDPWKPRFEWLNQPVILLFRWHQVPKNLVLPALRVSHLQLAFDGSGHSDQICPGKTSKEEKNGRFSHCQTTHHIYRSRWWLNHPLVEYSQNVWTQKSCTAQSSV